MKFCFTKYMTLNKPPLEEENVFSNYNQIDGSLCVLIIGILKLWLGGGSIILDKGQIGWSAKYGRGTFFFGPQSLGMTLTVPLARWASQCRSLSPTSHWNVHSAKPWTPQQSCFCSNGKVLFWWRGRKCGQSTKLGGRGDKSILGPRSWARIPSHDPWPCARKLGDAREMKGCTPGVQASTFEQVNRPPCRNSTKGGDFLRRWKAVLRMYEHQALSRLIAHHVRFHQRWRFDRRMQVILSIAQVILQLFDSRRIIFSPTIMIESGHTNNFNL